MSKISGIAETKPLPGQLSKELGIEKWTWVSLSLVVDALIFNFGVILAFLIRFVGKLPAFNFQAYANQALIFTVIQVGCFFLYDLYNVQRPSTGFKIFDSVVKAVTLASILDVTATFFSRYFTFPRPVFLLAWILNIVLLSGWRLMGTKVLKIKWPKRNILLVGCTEQGKELYRNLNSLKNWGYNVLGFVDKDPSRWDGEFGGAKILGDIKSVERIVEAEKVDQIIITSPVGHREIVEELARANESQVRVDVIPDLYEIFIGDIDLNLLGDIPLIELTKEPVPQWIKISKRLGDTFISLAILILTLPFLLIALVLIKLSSRGPVIYSQERVGQRGKIFDLYKLRTMIHNAELDTGPVFAAEDDPRITSLGRFLRMTRIDEIPQLYNVIKGDMSFIGPRPERPHFVKKFIEQMPEYAERFQIKPGITGLAQVSGEYATNARNKLKYDLMYIYHQSLLLDLKIFAKTIKVILNTRGAR